MARASHRHLETRIPSTAESDRDAVVEGLTNQPGQIDAMADATIRLRIQLHPNPLPRPAQDREPAPAG